MEAIVCVGIPRSGKTTYAKSLKATHIDINRDNARLVITGLNTKQDYWKQKGRKISETEKLVTKYCNDQIKLAVLCERSVIISDTNLTTAHRESLIILLNEYGFNVVVKDFPISYEQAMKRNESSGVDYVKKAVMASMWKKWVVYAGLDKLPEREEKIRPYVYIVDIDNTVASHEGLRSPFDWMSVDKDIPRVDVIRVVKAVSGSHHGSVRAKLVFLSGRDEVCRQSTTQWLKEHVTDYQTPELHMRPEGSTEKDYDVKKKLYLDHIHNEYTVLGVFDDRSQVVRLWRDLGFTVFNVGDIDNEF